MEKIAETPEGYFIYRKKNENIGGYDFYSDSAGGGAKIIDSMVSLSELRAVVRYLEDKEYTARLEKCVLEGKKFTL